MITSDLQVPFRPGFADGRVSLRPGRRACIYLAIIPIVDSVANQLQNALGVSVGPLSMLQALRGGLTVIMTGMVIAYFYTIRACDPIALGAAAVFFYSLLTYVCKEVIVTGSVELENVTHYAQMVYWLEIWLLAVAVFDTPARRRLALRCILAAGLIACVSIFHGYLTGTRLLYENQDITASSGLFNTGKGIAGVLVVSGIASAYLLRDRTDSLGSVIACAMFAGTFLTYARAGLVALLAALCAILGWVSVLRRNATVTRWAGRLLIWCLLVGAIGYVVVGTDDLAARWKDMADPEQAGSGRSVFWKVALDSFWNADLADQALGHGYVGMCKVIQQGYGMRIHTHNDFLDMLLVGGALGVVSLLVFWVTMIVRLRSLHAADAGSGAALAILAGVFSQSMLTGQMFDPSTMSVYTIAFVCVTGASAEEYYDDPYLRMYPEDI